MANNAVSWTPMQSAAIETRNKTLLVSAAAGSGKTAVLTERIVKRLCDKNDPADISRMLIVTYTKAAANELKVRISKAISGAIAKDITNRHLRKQLLLLSSAKISTIHSFCFDVVKSNSKALGLPAAITIAGEPELLILARQIMSKVIDDAYNNIFDSKHVPQSFYELADIFSPRTSDNSMCEALIKLYTSLQNYPEGIEFLKICSDELKEEATLEIYHSKHAEIIISKIGSYANYLLNEYRLLENKIKSDDILYPKCAPLLYDEISFLESINDNIANAKFDLVYKLFNAFSVSRFPTITKYSSQLKEDYKSLREKLKCEVIAKLKDLFGKDASVLREETELTSELIYTVYSILYRFDILFTSEKKRLGRLDFSDLERYTLDLLYKNGSPTDIAHEISKTFDEIYIDEYQDTNYVQDLIFSSISKPDNRFMVGDIKQSIYSFRGAAPESFSNYRDAFVNYESKAGKESTANTIFLSSNFRCDSTVVDFCNTVFSCLFRNATGRIPYYDSDNLDCSKIDGNKFTSPVNIILAGENSDPESKYISEAKYIAGEIKRLITSEKKKDGTPIRPSDIAILTKARASSIPIENALNDLGVQCSNNIETEFFENSEILLVMALLNTIDNPLRDIYLAGTLKSPLFNFTLDDLVIIRAFDRTKSLYEALALYTEETGFEKGKYFLERLEYFRTLASGSKVDRLIRKLYHECGLFKIVSSYLPDGAKPESARDNLVLLYKYAKDFEASSFKGLNSFIQYVNDIIAQKTKIPVKSKAGAADAVQIMTIHASKGLEFPVVFLAAAHKRANTQDKSNIILIDRHAGASIDLPGPILGLKKKTFHKKALEYVYDDNTYEETMRVLYVALTRARERLYITGEYKDPEKEYEKIGKEALNVCPYTILKNHPYMKLVLIPVLSAAYNSEDKCRITLPKIDQVNISEVISDSAQVTPDKKESKKILEQIRQQLDFVYPHANSLNIPSKLSVSSLSRSILDEGVSFESDENALLNKLLDTKPDFITKKTKESTAADRGTATHIFMQFCNFKNVEENGAVKEIERLLSLNYFGNETAELINCEQVEKFFEGELYQNTIKSATKLWREYRFNVELPAHVFTSDPEKRSALRGETLFVQGIIDCFTQNPDTSFTLIDYKTDHMPFSMKKNKKDFEAMLSKRHAEQLKYYKRALEILTKKPVDNVLIYSFALNKAIDITDMCDFED